MRILSALLVGAMLSAAALAADAPAPAVLLSVPVPITGTRDMQTKAAILRHVDALRADPTKRGVLVLRFDAAADASAAGSDFGRSLELARFLADGRLTGIKTIAYLPDGVVGHAVLPALACEEIMMAAEATLGPANTDEPIIDEAMRAAYRQIAATRRTVPPAVAVALLDPAAKVLRVSTDDGEQYVEAADLAAVKERVAVLATEDLLPMPLAVSGRRARELGIVRRLVASPADVARAVGVPEGSLAIDAAAADGWKPFIVAITGPITPDLVARTKMRLEAALAAGTTLLIVQLDSPGGAAEQSLVLATWLAQLDPARVRTVAYVPEAARADAALIAMACDELVMHPQALLGGGGAATPDGRAAQAVIAAWREGVARKRGRTWSLPVALALPDVVVEKVTQPATGRFDFMSEEELAARDDRDEWRPAGRLGVGPIQLAGRAAEGLGITAHVVDDRQGLERAYALTGDIGTAEPRWSETLLDALASPGLAWLLLLIGGAGLYIELHTPGFGFGGFISMVAFIVYFWSQYLHGTSGWLEVLLFLAGVVCLAAEVFVLPGFGVLGLGGGLLVIAALVLASQTFVVPANDYQISQLQWSLLGILGAAVGVAVLAALTRRWLPAAPVFRNVLLAPPEEPIAAGEPLDELLGAEGITTSRLAPAGKARLAGGMHDVTTAGELIEPGMRVLVVDVRGSRVVVRSVEP